MLNRILRTNAGFPLALIRIALGIVMAAHGCQKMLGWFGGGGFSQTMSFFQNGMHVPAPLAFLAIAAEFFGGIGLILGALTRIAAFGITCNMLVAVFTVHIGNGFFMNWAGNQKGEGFEYHVLVLSITLALMIFGAGPISVDAALAPAESKRG